MNIPLESEVTKRFGVLPNFFRLGSSDPTIAINLWGFAQFAYLDNPLPSLFKERLFVYLSRFCEVRYCIARHVGFLAGLGYPSGDSSCLPQNVESILPLLRRSLPHGDSMLPLLAIYPDFNSPLTAFPAPDTHEEQALFACATHVFLQTSEASHAHETLRRVLGPSTLECLNLMLTFVRTAHFWTRLHPELAFEDDVTQLLATHEALSDYILKGAESVEDDLSLYVAAELKSLRKIRKQHENITHAYQELSIDHQYVKYSLHESEENLREIVSVMPAAVFAWDKEGMITFYNHQAVDICGQTPDLDDLPWASLNSRPIFSPEGTRLRPEALLSEVIATGIPIVNRELVLERQDVSKINLLANIKALRDSSGAVMGAVSVFQDITELKRIQQEREALLYELERSNRELSQFSYAVSHDLQAPVRGVRLLAQLLARRDDGLPKEASNLLVMIERAADGMESLIKSLLGYAQVGQGQLNRERVKVDQIVEAVRITLTALITETGAQIAYEPLPSVEADPILLQQLFQNLIVNAIQYHRPGKAPVVEISCVPSKEGWLFAVKDNGQGISSEYQDAIFEPLKRLHGKETPGTGLGLSVCRTIAARHGGRIWVESGGDYGATFLFTLPQAQESPSIRSTET